MRYAAVGLIQCFVLCGLAPSEPTDKPLVVDVWPGAAPGDEGSTLKEKRSEGKAVGTVIHLLTDVDHPTLTVYRPAKIKDVGAAVVICPGGGYSVLAMDLEGEDVAAWLNTIGVTGIVLKYRVPRRSSDPKDKPPLGPQRDVQRALSLVRGKAAEWGIDPKRIGVLGFSAGGNLATLAATNFDKRTYEPIDEVDKVSCRPDFAVLVYPAYLVAAGKDELAQEVRVRKECPPAFFAHAADDPVPAENSVVAYRAWRKAGASAELHIYASGGHGFGLRPSEQPCSTWPQRCGDWLKAQGLLKPTAAR
jgi:acetyl esterase/lipase